MRSRLSIKVAGMLAAAGLAAAGICTATADEPLKVAFVYLGPVGDGGWTYQHDLGRIALEKALGSR